MRKCRNQPAFDNPFVNLDEVDDEPASPFEDWGCPLRCEVQTGL